MTAEAHRRQNPDATRDKAKINADELIEEPDKNG
jgi:hypothetical protein